MWAHKGMTVCWSEGELDSVPPHFCQPEIGQDCMTYGHGREGKGGQPMGWDKSCFEYENEMNEKDVNKYSMSS